MTETERELDFLVAELREENGILRRALEEALRTPKPEAEHDDKSSY
jgi:hypothetical protein|tara:strand:+ start:777 stop:914 length:138 start_codon:yes stop_codon:yes gene_type:complete